MNKSYYIVTNQKIIDIFKSSKYFRVHLGMAVTMEMNGDRIISDKDSFAASYNHQYKTTILAKGIVGNIKFYLDYGIKEDTIACYLNLEEFLFNLDKDYLVDKGIDSYLGHILMSVDTKYQEITENQKKTYEENLVKQGNADTLSTNPGAVTYADIQEYLRKKKLK